MRPLRHLWDSAQVDPLSRLGRAILLSLALALALGARAEAALPTGFVGIVSDDVFARTLSYRDRALASQQRAGITLIRLTFDWARVEHRRNHYDFTFYDSVVASAAEHGIEILPVLFDPPSFRSSRPRHHAARGTYYPKHYGDLGAFGAAVARRYGPFGTLWTQEPKLPKVPITSYQVWNEPNLPVYSPPVPSARKYVALLKATARRIRAVLPSAEIVSAGMPDSRLSQPGLYTFVAQLYRAGARGAFNTLAINPYSRSSGGVITILKKVRRIMRHYHDSRAMLWSTEMGWSDRGPGAQYRVGLAGQASRIKQTIAALSRARRSLNLRGFIYYSWRDGKPYAPRFIDFWGLHTGLLASNGSPKPAFAAFTSAVAALKG